jgi:hypothetical protein
MPVLGPVVVEDWDWIRLWAMVARSVMVVCIAIWDWSKPWNCWCVHGDAVAVAEGRGAAVVGMLLGGLAVAAVAAVVFAAGTVAVVVAVAVVFVVGISAVGTGV